MSYCTNSLLETRETQGHVSVPATDIGISDWKLWRIPAVQFLFGLCCQCPQYTTALSGVDLFSFISALWNYDELCARQPFSIDSQKTTRSRISMTFSTNENSLKEQYLGVSDQLPDLKKKKAPKSSGNMQLPWTVNLKWHRTIQGLIRSGVVTRRSTASCCLPPKWPTDLGFEPLTLLEWQSRNPFDHHWSKQSTRMFAPLPSGYTVWLLVSPALNESLGKLFIQWTPTWSFKPGVSKCMTNVWPWIFPGSLFKFCFSSALLYTRNFR